MGRIMDDPIIYGLMPPDSLPVILVVDDDAYVRDLVLAFLQNMGYAFKGAADAYEALQIISGENIDLVISDINMRKINGLQFMEQAHRIHPHLPFIMITGFVPDYDYEDIINLGASDFIAKPFSCGELKAKILRIFREKKIIAQLNESLKNIKKIFTNAIGALASTLEIRDPYTAGHQRRVGELSCALAQALGLSAQEMEILYLAAAVHDVGKIGVPSEILAKPGKLNEYEMNLIRTHSPIGFDILQPLEFPWPIADMVRQHHERLDGSGYPQGLQGEEISMEARIIGVADVVEAMSAHRPYRPALDVEAALSEISKNRGVLYDRRVVDACIDLFTDKGFRFAG